VTDLDTLDRLALIEPPSEIPSPPYRVLSAEAGSIRNLDITLRLPRLFFETLASHVRTSNSHEHTQTPHVSMVPVGIWMRVWPALAARLQQLQRFHVWMDHEDGKSWSLVDERAILSSLTGSVRPENIDCLRQVTFNLPKLHPRYENAEHHFTESSRKPPPFVTIHRRLRQREFYEETAPGISRVTNMPDFPVLFELVEYTAQAGFGPGMSLEEVEEREREIWERGGDPEREVLGEWGGYMY
jgi:hypothetical protein